MNNATKIIAAFVVALSTVVPAVAAHGPKMGKLAQQSRTERVQPNDALGAMAYTPNTAPIEYPYDFGIGSQR